LNYSASEQQKRNCLFALRFVILFPQVLVPRVSSTVIPKRLFQIYQKGFIFYGGLICTLSAKNWNINHPYFKRFCKKRFENILKTILKENDLL